MIELAHWQDFPKDLRGGVLCVGNFDGVHRGHQRMLAAGRATADRHGLPLTVMTFDPHPVTLLRPASPHAPVLTFGQRKELLATFGPDVLLAENTSADFLDMSSENFLGRVVKDALGATHLVEGNNFTFGKGAAGTVETLRAAADAGAFQLDLVPTFEQALSDQTLVRVSSSLIRWLISQGRVADAALCLGRPFTLRGPVVKGKQRGRELGYPTANLQVSQVVPAPAVYAGRAVVDGRGWAAAISVGTNPTFNGVATTVEAFLLDFSGDLYGKTMDLEFHRFLRDQRKFSGIEPLKVQMARDVEAVRVAAGRLLPA